MHTCKQRCAWFVTSHWVWTLRPRLTSSEHISHELPRALKSRRRWYLKVRPLHLTLYRCTTHLFVEIIHYPDKYERSIHNIELSLFVLGEQVLIRSKDYEWSLCRWLRGGRKPSEQSHLQVLFIFRMVVYRSNTTSAPSFSALLGISSTLHCIRVTCASCPTQTDEGIHSRFLVLFRVLYS